MLDRLRVPDEIAVHTPPEAMRQTVVDVFEHFGMPGDDARQAAEVLLWADVRGVDTHGVSNMMRAYVAMFRAGRMNPAPEVRTLRESAGTATLDGDNGLGLATAPRAMALAIEKAREVGIGAVAMTNSQHFGAAGYHAAMAIEHDMIGLASTTGGLAITPTFGAKAMLGLNPIAIAAPAGREAPFVFDASMSSVAGNLITIAKRLEANVDPGWIATADGTPIMEPEQVPDEYLILPAGGTREVGSHKGYGLALAAEILTGLLSGMGPRFLDTQMSAHHFLAYRIDAFIDPGEFKASMDALLGALRETPPAPGQERVLYAGLPEHEIAEVRRENGIPYHPEVIGWFRELVGELGLEDRFEV